jgi:predicted ATPase/DNA-binding CsgD family transcriptional regulator
MVDLPVVGLVDGRTIARLHASADRQMQVICAGVRICGVAKMVGFPSFQTSFVSRLEQGLLERLLRANRVVTIVGPGGAGKTRLAVECMRALMDRHEDCVFVDVHATASGEALAGLVAEQLGAQVRTSDPFDAIATAVGAQMTLLVLDSCEPVVEACAALVHSLVAHTTTLSVLCTSRQPLGLDGETLVRLGPLGNGTVSLFTDRALLVDPGFDRTAVDQIERVCSAVDGIPLAIELAAAQLSHLSLADVERGLAQRAHLLARESTTIAPRHRSMRACVGWSLDLLTDADRRSLQALSMLRAGFDLATAQTMLALDATATATTVARLVARSLIVAERASPTRFSLFDVVREVTADERRASVADDELTVRYVAWAVQRCSAAAVGLEGVALEATVRQLLGDDADLSAAFALAADRGDLETAERMFGALALHWITAGRFAQAETWLATCQSLVGASPLQPRSLWTAALVAVYAGRSADAIHFAGEALDAARGTGDESLIARALDVIGFATMQDDAVIAEQLLVEAVDHATRAHDPWCRADAAQIAGFTALGDGRPDDARRHLLAGRPIAESLGHHQLLAWDRAGLALVDARSGRFVIAAAGLLDAEIHATVTGDPNITASVLAFRAQIAVQLGDAGAWVHPVDEQLDRCVTLGAGQGAAELVVARLELAAATGDLAPAEWWWEQATLAVGGAAQMVHRRMCHAAAACALLAGDHDEARRRLTMPRSSRGRSASAGVTDVWCAVVSLHTGDHAQARRLLRRASDDRALPQAHIARHDLAIAWAALSAAEGEPERARDLLELAGGLLAGDAAAPSLVVRLLPYVLVDQAGTIEPCDARLDDAIALGCRRSTRPGVRFGWSALTVTERRVIALAAEGLTNKSIASRMDVAQGTIKSHLEHIYAKTAIANRTELAAEFHRLVADGSAV